MVEQLPLPVFWMIIAFLLAMTAIFVAAGLKARRNVAEIKATPTSNIGMATPGYVEFEGTTGSPDGLLLTAPLGSRPPFAALQPGRSSTCRWRSSRTSPAT